MSATFNKIQTGITVNACLISDPQQLAKRYRDLNIELDKINLYRQVLRAEMQLLILRMAASERDIFFATYPDANEKDFLKAIHEALTDFTIAPPNS